MTRTAAQIRQEFLDFFRQRGHAIVPSSPVVPLDDPTLLFTNAGMNQFKPYFLGLETPKHPRVADTQKCIRAGGKHNDLDDVGHDTYHHTFFEMLGNWSFGDYFKKEAIAWAWELLADVWGIDPTRLHATHFGGDAAEGIEPDTEARDLWRQILPPERVHAGSKKDNFWEMGETGPCGPCSEIHFDLTADKSGAKLVNAGDARVIEIWNLVFIQFNRAADGKLTPLPAKHVDTGMGFERVTAVLQGHNNNYATDVFVPILQAIEKISGHTYGSGGVGVPPGGAGILPGGAGIPPGGAGILPANRYARFIPGDMRDESCRVIADHIRCLTFALADGAVPDREGRGYVLRRILRRAVRYGWQYLNLHEPFLHKLVPAVVNVMGETFPELKTNPSRVQAIIIEEERAFLGTIAEGMGWFEFFLANDLRDQLCRQHPGWRVSLDATDHGLTYGADIILRNPDTGEQVLFEVKSLGEPKTGRTLDKLLPQGAVLSGLAAFTLHDRYGFPIDMTEVMAREKGLTVDMAEYERLMEEARQRARAGTRSSDAWCLDAVPADSFEMHAGATNDSYKYQTMVLRATVVAAFRVESAPVPGLELFSGQGSLRSGERGGIIVDKTCFYAEAGGQVGDQGTIEADGAYFRVEDTRRAGPTVLHLGTVLRGAFSIKQDVDLRVDPARRATMKNHTATHVMNWALREVLGEHVQQKGSLVDHEKTRFDFSHPKPLTPEEVERVEQLVNARVLANLPVYIKDDAALEDALKINGLRAVFGERYPDPVRVMSVGMPVEDLKKNPGNAEWRKYSIEFCGGTHLKATGEIEHFTITTEEAVAKGIRRIVAVTGETARRIEETGVSLVQKAEQLKRGPADTVATSLAELHNTLATATIPLRHRHRLRELMAELQAIVKLQQKSDAADAAEIVKREVAALLARAEKIGDTTVVVGEMPDVPLEQLKMGADWIKQKCGSAAVLFGVRVAPESEREAPASPEGTGPDVASVPRGRRDVAEAVDDQRRPQGGDATTDRLQTGPTGRALLLAAMTPDLVKKGLKAGDLVKAIAPIIGGGGGGPPTMAQAGGKQPEKISEALSAGRDWIRAKL